MSEPMQTEKTSGNDQGTAPSAESEPLAGIGDEAIRNAERWAMISRLASHIAHELGTPLNVISGRAMMIASGEAHGQEAVDSAKIIVDQSTKLTGIIRQFLSEARKPSKREPTDLVAICGRALGLVSPLAAERRVRVVLEPSSERMVVNIAPIKLLQVTNAIQSMRDGGTVTITLQREQKFPGDDASRPGAAFACVTVRDEGEGIAKEDIPQIFKLFYSTRDPSEGTGLGLSIVQGIVREHGGWIDVESERGRGTAFKVCLPEGDN
jgi:two-component system, NtrC family, sensor kinase